MKTKQHKKGVESENRILEAAIDLFAEKGYRDTKVSDIVKVAGLTQAAFYLYFPSKEEIFHEILQRFYLKLEKHLPSFLHESGVEPTHNVEDAPIRIRRNIEALFHLFQEQPRLTKIFLTEERNSDEVEKLIHQTLVNNLSKNQELGLIRKDLSPEMMANSMMGMCTQVILLELLKKQRPAKEVANDVTQFILFGLLNNI